MEFAFVLAVILRHLKNSRSPTVEVSNTLISATDLFGNQFNKKLFGMSFLCLDCAIGKYRLLHNTYHGFTGLP